MPSNPADIALLAALPCTLGWQSAFKHWLSFVRRGFAFDDNSQEVLSGEVDLASLKNAPFNNHFYLINASQAKACDDAGEVLATSMHIAAAEHLSNTSIEVRYRPCKIPAVFI
jgi:hypothetical protein